MNDLLKLNLPPLVLDLLPIVAALAVAVVGFLVFRWLFARLGKATGASRLQAFAGGVAFTTTEKSPIGSRNHKIRLAFSRYGLDVAGRESFMLLVVEILAGGGLTVVMIILGLPLFTSLIGMVAGYVLVDGLVTRAWNKMRTDIEAEIPAMLSGLKSAITTAPNVPQALADTSRTLRAGGPLRSWAEKAASQMHSEGQPCLEELRKEAAAVSSSLSVCVELVGRMWTTGGQGYAQAFESAASNLRDVLSARVLARARGSGAQSTTNLLMGMAFAMIVYLNHTPAIASVVRTPLVQGAYAAIFLMIVYGYNMINSMIENAV